MEYETYRIPANYTDAGRVLGQFPVRNAVEAIILALPPAYFCFAYLPFGLTVRIIFALVLSVPLGGFALGGVNDDSLSAFLKSCLLWLVRRKIIFYRGTPKSEHRRRTLWT